MDRRLLLAAAERATVPGRPRLEVLGPAPPPVKSVGLVAGSFDPMTVAHAALAEALGTDLVLLVWSPATMPKAAGPGGEPSTPLLPPEDRLASLAAWCGSRPWARAAVSSHGLLADQVEAMDASFPRSVLVIGMGSDKLRQLFDPAWYEDRDAVLARMFGRAEVVAAIRGGDRPPVDARWSDRVRFVELPNGLSEVSSRAVRAAVRRGEDVTTLVPPEVQPFVGPR
jgi:nicotinic acid mononucleotide adenylyltransferase